MTTDADIAYLQGELVRLHKKVCLSSMLEVDAAIAEAAAIEDLLLRKLLASAPYRYRPFLHAGSSAVSRLTKAKAG